MKALPSAKAAVVAEAAAAVVDGHSVPGTGITATVMAEATAAAARANGDSRADIAAVAMTAIAVTAASGTAANTTIPTRTVQTIVPKCTPTTFLTRNRPRWI